MAFAIFGEHVADVEVGQLQEIAEVLFVLVTIEAAEGAAAVAANVVGVGGVEEACEGSEHGRALGGGERYARGRHFAFGDAVVEADPAVADGPVGKVCGQGGEVEAALGVLGVVAAVAEGGYERLCRGGQGGQQEQESRGFHRFPASASLILAES
jgi:hypothetical protein